MICLDSLQELQQTFTCFNIFYNFFFCVIQ